MTWEWRTHPMGGDQWFQRDASTDDLGADYGPGEVWRAASSSRWHGRVWVDGGCTWNSGLVAPSGFAEREGAQRVVEAYLGGGIEAARKAVTA